jgi:DNA-directed RNA polymerase subunit alpha
MKKLTCIENTIENKIDSFGCFIIEPLEVGQGITLGNSIRRTLLSDLSGLAISGVRINNLKHEFDSLPGVREDVLEILLNLKEIIFKESIILKKKKESLNQIKTYLNVKGPLIVTASMLKVPKEVLKIINPNQYICTIFNNSELFLELDLEKGRGYKLADQKRNLKHYDFFDPIKPSTLFIDSIFMPIKKVNYKIKLIHDTQGNIKESLILEILTNGSISPQRALQESLKTLLSLFYSLFIDENFLELSSEISKDFN